MDMDKDKDMSWAAWATGALQQLVITIQLPYCARMAEVAVPAGTKQGG